MNAEMTPEEVTVRLHRAMDGATGLPPEDIDQIEMLIRVGERLVAVEALCTQIYEYEISIDPDLVQQLVERSDSPSAPRSDTRVSSGTRVDVVSWADRRRPRRGPACGVGLVIWTLLLGLAAWLMGLPQNRDPARANGVGGR